MDMPYKAIPKETKEEVLRRIKDEGLSVPQASKEYGLSQPAIYRWLNNSTKRINPILENNRLKREIKGLHEFIGQVTIELNKQKKEI